MGKTNASAGSMKRQKMESLLIYVVRE